MCVLDASLSGSSSTNDTIASLLFQCFNQITSKLANGLIFKSWIIFRIFVISQPGNATFNRYSIDTAQFLQQQFVPFVHCTSTWLYCITTYVNQPPIISVHNFIEKSPKRWIFYFFMAALRLKSPMSF